MCQSEITIQISTELSQLKLSQEELQCNFITIAIEH